MKKLLQIVISLLLLGFLYWKLDVNLSAMLSAITTPQWLAVALVFPMVINPLIVNNRWRTFLGAIGVEESVWTLMRITFTSTFLGLVIPSSQGYDVLRMYYIEKRHPEHRGKVGSTILVERLLGLVILIIIGIVASLMHGDSQLQRWVFGFAVVFVLCLVLAFMPWGYHFIQRLLTGCPVAKGVCGYLSKLYEGIYHFPFRASLWLSVLLIVMLQLSNIAVVYLLFRAVGTDIPFVYHCLALPIISILSMIPISFGGFGLREGGFALLYSGYGMSGSTLMSVSLLYYMVIMLVPACIGGIWYMVFSLVQNNE